MATTFNFYRKPGAGPIYQQVAAYFREEITLEHLPALALLPSIRKLMADLKISRTTAESAYQVLISEGYISSMPGKGYRVEQFLPHTRQKETKTISPIAAASTVLYDFSNNYIDTSTFDTALWRRCLNSALRNPRSIAGYGDYQGEAVLRKVLAQYSYSSRGVVTTPEQIIVGAGLQSLLAILLPLLPVKEKTIGMEAPGFPQAEEICENYGWQVKTFDPAEPSDTWPQLLMISPANPYKGRSLSDKEKNNLIVASKLSHVYILEDDYNGEFRYLNTPTPALHSFGNSEQIIYLASFSRTLLPSLRISYLVLPKKLLSAYRQKAKFFNQTSSTIEQLALAEYIEQGYLARHVKKLRSLYNEKNLILQQTLLKTFGKKVTILDYASGLHLRIALHYSLSAQALAKKALQHGIRVIPILGTTSRHGPEVLLSFAGIAKEAIPKGIAALQKALEN